MLIVIQILLLLVTVQILLLVKIKPIKIKILLLLMSLFEKVVDTTLNVSLSLVSLTLACEVLTNTNAFKSNCSKYCIGLGLTGMGLATGAQVVNKLM